MDIQDIWQQRPRGPPPSRFQQGPPVPRPPMFQHAAPPVPPKVGPPGHPVYQHLPPGYQHVSSGPLQQVPPLPVPSSGISSGHLYLSPHPPAPLSQQAHGGSQVPHFHSSAHQQSQWSQNVHPIPPIIPTSGPRNVAPPPLQGQVLHRGQIPPGAMQLPQHALPPPPPRPPFSSFSSPSFGTSAVPIPRLPHMPSMAPPPPPPPLPSSPPRSPPNPPVSPPPTSSPGSKTKFPESILSQGRNNDSTADVMASDSVDAVKAHNQSDDILPALHTLSGHDGATGYSGQPRSLTNASISHSPTDSDMDMEDDITHPDEEEQTQSCNGHESFPISTEQGGKQSQVSSSAAKHSLVEDTLVGKLSCSVSSGSEEQEQGPKGSREHDESTTGNPSPKLDVSVLNSVGQTDHPFNSIAHESSCLHDDLIKAGASANMAGGSSEKPSDENAKGKSPFRLLQDYASDDSSESGHQVDLNPVAVSTPIEASITSFGTDINYNSGDGLGPKSLSESQKKRFDSVTDSSAECSPSIRPQSKNTSLSQNLALQADVMSITAGKIEDLVDNKHENQDFAKVGSSPKVLRNTSALRDDVAHGHSGSGNVQTEDPKSISGLSKVDEFGRLVRENHSDSDSGDLPRNTQRRSKRGRSRSPIRGRSHSRSRSPIRGRSRSPHDRRRRRSPRRRRERRGRSRSLSPKRRRNRSKSPSYRRGGEFGGDKMRDKALPQKCFDFTRGKCFRGASCRYLHHESDNTDRSRSYRSKQQQNVPISSKTLDLYADTEAPPTKRPVHEEIEHKSQGSKQDVQLTAIREDVKEELDKPTTQLCNNERLADAENEKVPGDFADPVPTSMNSEIERSQVHCSDQVTQNFDHQPLQMNDPLDQQISPDQTSTTVQNALPVDVPYVNQESANQSYSGISSMDILPSSQNISSHTFVPEISQYVGNPPSNLLLSSTSLAQDTSVRFPQPVPRDYNMVPPSTSFPHQHSQFTVPSNTSLNSLPPPPPPLPFVNHPNATPGHYGQPSAQFQQNVSPLRNFFPYGASLRPYGTHIHNVSQSLQQETYLTVQESYQSSCHRDDFGPRTLPGEPNVGPGHGGEDSISGRPLQDAYPKSSCAQDNWRAQHPPFPGEKMSPGGLSTPSSQTHPYLHQPFYGLPPAPDGVSAHLGDHGKVMPSMSRYASDNLGKDHPSHLPALGVSRISSHFNPYASTFDQPLSSRFSSNILSQEKDTSYSNKYGTPYSNVLAAKGILAAPVGDQYDPLYDSIEPSSNSVRKPDSSHQRDLTGESDIMWRVSGSNKPLVVEDHNKQKGTGAVSLENDEYGEIADEEVGTVENRSGSNPHDATDMAAGEVEIEQVQAPGKTKTSRNPKSTKLFKIAIADFVKEVLKPSWRQGNMSKEAFKTIVKKTIDKVSGAMKSHQIPKSREKIDRYIDSSQRKLTKLVMGYVDKYAKV